jgi:hypothetical protein
LGEWIKKTPGLSHLDLSTPEAQSNVFKNETVMKLFNSEVPLSVSLPSPLCLSLSSPSPQLVAACSMMKGYEKIHRWCPVIEPFSQENHLMTPKMSLRRNLIVKVSLSSPPSFTCSAPSLPPSSLYQKFEASIEEMYVPHSGSCFEVIHDPRPKLKDDI